MRYAFLIALLTLFAAPATADQRQAFYGTWGTAQQCARDPIMTGGTVLAEPFKINSDGVRQGPIWCSLKWFPMQTRKDDLFTAAIAQCGEDGIRDFFLRMKLSGGELTLIWSMLRSNGPLARCPGS